MHYLDALLIKILLLARDEVGAHNSGLQTGGDLAGEHTAESVEPALVGGGHHLGDVHHEGCLGVALLDTGAGGVVGGSFVQQLSSG